MDKMNKEFEEWWNSEGQKITTGTKGDALIAWQSSRAQPAEHDTMQLAEMVLSDCGISTVISDRLQRRVAARIQRHVDGLLATQPAGEAVAKSADSSDDLIAKIEHMCNAEESAFNMTYGAWYSDCKGQKLPPIDAFVVRVQEAIAAHKAGQPTGDAVKNSPLPRKVHPKASLDGDAARSQFHVGGLVTMNQDEYPALGDWFVQLWEGEDVAARVYGNDRETLNRRISALNTAPPAQVPMFVRKRIERAISEAVNPKGMSVHDGMAHVPACDLQMLLNASVNTPKQPAQVPDGYVLVPIDADDEMVDAGCLALSGSIGGYEAGKVYKCWDAMLATAQQPKGDE